MLKPIDFVLLLAAALLLSGCRPAGPRAARRRPVTINVPADKPTVQAAIDAARDGDVVLVAPGVYPGGIKLEGKTITLASHYLKTGDGKYIEQTVLGEEEERCGYVIMVGKTAGPGTRIIGFTIRNGNDGIRCHAKIQVLHNRVTACRDGIDYEGGGGVCRNNVFELNRDDGIDLDWHCEVLIEKNVIRDNRDDGIEIRLYRYEEEKTLNIIVRDNVISGSGEDGIQIIDHPGPSRRVLRIERNVISDTGKAAVGFMDGARTGEDYRAAAIPDRIYVVANTFLDNHYGLTGGGNLIVLNNIFAHTGKTALKGCAGGAVAAHNLFWKNGRDFEASNVQKASTLFKDPLLDEEDRPRAGSPCIDAGASSFKWKGESVLEVPRRAYSGAAPDLGAFERRPGKKGR